MMLDGNAIPAGLFVLGISLLLVADGRLRVRDGASWHQGCVTAVGAGLAFLACAYAIH
jgi:hypothetical protein